MSNIIEVSPCVGKTTHTAPAWQYDYGQILHINGIDQPASYRAEFFNTTRGDAVATIQTTDEIVIPAQFLVSGASVYVWLVVVDEDSRTTEYSILVPVMARAKPTDEQLPPEEQSEIDQAIAALNNAVTVTTENAATAVEAANRAEQAISTAGYVFFYIDDNGDLICQRTEGTEVDFFLEDGDLYMEVVVS